MFKKILILTLMLLTANVFAGETSAPKQQISQETVIQKFISWDKKLKTLDAFYMQEMSFEGTVISKTFGRLLKKANKLRLETLEEGRLTQYAVTDKKIINIFDAKGAVITEMDWDDWQQTQQNKSLFDFGNYAKILEEHKVIAFKVLDEGYLLSLTPKKGESYTLSFLLDKNNFFPKEINLLSEGVNSKTVLDKTQINKNLAEDIFK